MSNIPESIILRTSYYDGIKSLKDEQLGKLFRAIFEFAKNGEKEVELDAFTEMAYGFMAHQIKTDTDERESKRKRYREMGQKSAENRRVKKEQENTLQPISNAVPTTLQPSSNAVPTTFPAHAPALEDYINNININNNNDFSNEKSVYDSLSRARAKEQFDIWWDLYDKKVGKEKALRKWLSLKDEDRQKCIDVAPRYVEAKPDKRYRKDPLTYLNGSGWNDEIIDDNEKTNGNGYDKLEARRGSPAPRHTAEEYEQGNTWAACE